LGVIHAAFFVIELWLPVTIQRLDVITLVSLWV
jgi:hypothetical protein